MNRFSASSKPHQYLDFMAGSYLPAEFWCYSNNDLEISSQPQDLQPEASQESDVKTDDSRLSLLLLTAMLVIGGMSFVIGTLKLSEPLTANTQQAAGYYNSPHPNDF